MADEVPGQNPRFAVADQPGDHGYFGPRLLHVVLAQVGNAGGDGFRNAPWRHRLRHSDQPHVALAPTAPPGRIRDARSNHGEPLGDGIVRLRNFGHQ